MLTHRPKLTENELQLVEESFTPTNRKPNCLFIFGDNWYQKPSGSPTRSIEFCINWFCGSVYLPSAGGFRMIQSHGKIDQQNHHRLFHPQNNRVPKKCQMPTRTLKLNHDGWVDWYVLHNYDNVTMINFPAPQAKKQKSTTLTRNCSFFATTEQSKNVLETIKLHCFVKKTLTKYPQFFWPSAKIAP